MSTACSASIQVLGVPAVSVPISLPSPAGRRPVSSSKVIAASENTSAVAFHGVPAMRSGGL